MGLDALTIVGLVLGVLGSLERTFMCDFGKKVGRLLVRIDQNVGALVLTLRLTRRKSRRILRCRNETGDAEGLSMTSADTQVRAPAAAAVTFTQNTL